MPGETSTQEMSNLTEDTVSLIQHDGEERTQSINNGCNTGRKRNRAREIRMIIVACFVFGIAITTALIVDIYTGSHHTGHAAVVSDVKECADVGLELIKAGGSAVDAAIGTMLCVGVMNPESSGLGGGGFMLTVVPQKDEEVAEVIDFREVAPLGASKDMFHGNESLASWGGLSVAVPGEIRGFEIAHKKYGKLKWSEVIEPAIKLAKEGFRVTAHTGKVLKHFRKDAIGTRLGKMIAPDGVNFLKEGQKMSNPALAETLQQIADKGADVLYNGPIADGIVAAVKSANGILTNEDLTNYKPISRNAINATYEGYQVITTPLPSGGPVLVSMLNILEGFNFTNKVQGKSLTYHYIIEAMKFAFAQRSLLEDSNDLANITEQMLSKEHAKTLRDKISPNKTFKPPHYGPFLVKRRHMALRMSPLLDLMANSLASQENGIILNNEMADFSIPGVTKIDGAGPPKANFIAPGKRPLSSCVPTVVLHKEKRCWFRMSLGASGGDHIPQAVAQVLVNYLAFNDSLSQSIEKPRVYYGISTGISEIEADRFQDNKMASSIVKALRDKGHNITEHAGLADANGLSYFQDQVTAHGDSRRGGQGSAQF
ncbi:Glutathione hydrolase 7 [Desmophyllum pertusum]|uniref:Glutathione hydrolase 7 n=1 Tax=Desmophyllum pertusum TaxID=174260 RepID=A0A9X0CQJ8_9CNID|nr:Glutathione hydrolase 7 [Desmophyllum pertusum]